MFHQTPFLLQSCIRIDQKSKLYGSWKCNDSLCSLKAGVRRWGHKHRGDGRFHRVLPVPSSWLWPLAPWTSRGLQAKFPLWLLTSKGSSDTKVTPFYRLLHQQHFGIPHQRLNKPHLPDSAMSSNLSTCSRVLVGASSYSNAINVCGEIKFFKTSIEGLSKIYQEYFSVACNWF